MNALELSRALSAASLTSSELLALNKLVISKLNALRSTAVTKFVVGEKVSFRDQRGCRLTGVVTGRTAKSVRVEVPSTPGSFIPYKWTVAPSLLTKEA